MKNFIEGFSEQPDRFLQSGEAGKDKEQRPAHADEILDEKRPPELFEKLTVNSKIKMI